MILSQTLFENGQRPPHQGLGLGQPVGDPQQLGQVIEVSGDFTLATIARTVVLAHWQGGPVRFEVVVGVCRGPV
jgi:hypothetical protein